jgi:CHAT domain-containing protein
MDQLNHHAVSTYTLSLTAMLDTRHLRKTLKAEPVTRLLAISQSKTEGLVSLPFAPREVEAIRKCFLTLRAEVRPTIVHLRNEDATVERIMEELNQSSFVHFACHAQADRDDPRESSFILWDTKHRLPLNRIINRKLGQRQSRRRLAVLSACMTAVGHERLQEEAVHLAASMVIAGYPSVVATMWSIRDPDAPRVMQKLYERLCTVCGQSMVDMSGGDIAYALHDAVQSLRDSLPEAKSKVDVDKRLLCWVPFVHFGV